jgi:5-methylcytosine-specific restriction endonuclease McrA
VGRTDDAKVPPRVRVRIFLREDGRCHLSGRKITPGDAWDLDHKTALINGGEHRESNLFPALRDKHREKTREDIKTKAKVARVKARHIGVKTDGRKLQSRGFDKRLRKRMDGTVERRDA